MSYGFTDVLNDGFNARCQPPYPPYSTCMKPVGVDLDLMNDLFFFFMKTHVISPWIENTAVW